MAQRDAALKSARECRFRQVFAHRPARIEVLVEVHVDRTVELDRKLEQRVDRFAGIGVVRRHGAQQLGAEVAGFAQLCADTHIGRVGCRRCECHDLYVQ